MMKPLWIFLGLLTSLCAAAYALPATPVTYTRGLDLSGTMQGAGGVGGLMAKYLYDPYGNTISAADYFAEANKYRFSSKEIHSASGLYNYGERIYDPLLQRWLTTDPIGELGGLNLYEFTENNPVNYIDTHGLSVLDTILNITDYVPYAGAGIRQIQGNVTMQNMMEAKDYHSLQEFQLDHPGYAGTVTSGNMTAVAGAAAVTAGVATVYVTAVTSVTPTGSGAQCMMQTGEAGLEKLAARTGAAETRGGTYLLRDPVTGKIMRTGRSNDLLRRAAEHGRDPALRDFQFQVVDRTDNYAQQRGLEQLPHDMHNPPLNFNRPINPTNPNRQSYLDAALQFLQGGNP
jgi:RHS repeat-associated protein